MTALDNPLEAPPATAGARIAVAIDRFLFTPVRPEPLAICRILFFTGMFVIFRKEDFSSWAGIQDELFKPVYLFRRFGWEPLSEVAIHRMQIAWLTALVFSAIGFLTPLSIGVVACLGSYLLGLASSFGKIGHGDASLILASFLLMLSKCGDAWSVDAVIRGSLKRATPTASGEYYWPVQSIRILLALVFFCSGCTKLMYSGLNWVLTDHLQILIMQTRYGLKEVPLPALATWIALRPMLCHIAAGATIALEIGFPIALFSRKLRYPILISAALMQTGIALVMGVFFVQFALLYLFWIPFEKLFPTNRHE